MRKRIHFISILLNLAFISTEQLLQTPPKRENSFDCYGAYLHEKVAKEHLSVSPLKGKTCHKQMNINILISFLSFITYKIPIYAV
jgi:hypothetical protein